MTDDEAAAVADVIGRVHGNCYTCAAYAACEMEKAMPWHNWFELVAATHTTWTEDDLRAEAPCEPDR